MPVVTHGSQVARGRRGVARRGQATRVRQASPRSRSRAAGCAESFSRVERAVQGLRDMNQDRALVCRQAGQPLGLPGLQGRPTVM